MTNTTKKPFDRVSAKESYKTIKAARKACAERGREFVAPSTLPSGRKTYIYAVYTK